MLYQNNTIYLFQSTTTMALTWAEEEEGEVAASSEEGEDVANSMASMTAVTASGTRRGRIEPPPGERR